MVAFALKECCTGHAATTRQSPTTRYHFIRCPACTTEINGPSLLALVQLWNGWITSPRRKAALERDAAFEPRS
jgi:hypothetical protein